MQSGNPQRRNSGKRYPPQAPSTCCIKGFVQGPASPLAESSILCRSEEAGGTEGKGGTEGAGGFSLPNKTHRSIVALATGLSSAGFNPLRDDFHPQIRVLRFVKRCLAPPGRYACWPEAESHSENLIPPSRPLSAYQVSLPQVVKVSSTYSARSFVPSNESFTNDETAVLLPGDVSLWLK